MFEVEHAPSVQQRRDNWSRDQVRALRRKVKNLRAELRIQNQALRRGKRQAEEHYRRLQAGHRSYCQHRNLANVTLNRLAEENAWYRQQIKSVADTIEYSEKTHKQTRLGDVLFLLRWTLDHPLFPPPTTDDAPAPTAPASAGGE